MDLLSLTFSQTFGKKFLEENTLGNKYAYFPSSDLGAFNPEPTKITSYPSFFSDSYVTSTPYVLL